MITLIVTALIAYLIGSIPFGFILTRLSGLGDIRTIGSGNIGATNVLRTGNKGLALATLALDFAKAFGGIGFAHQLSQAPADDLVAFTVIACSVVLGHMFPIWLKFKGGKGVACIFGIGYALSGIMGGWMTICWLTIFALYRYSSASAILGIPAALIIASQNPKVGTLAYALAIPTLLMLIKHHENIRRLLKGEEHRFSFTKKEDS